ncbi:hypothetical protein Agub_g8965 [Astrephomene gubernaculifera]|uniref:DNA ligase n=1 Tax=Astrephomene gubernaculifera TaxID=47775 RepID=A0AAD3DSW0_9CHLO|nr:hypothetical protein Agub_g8965 [Astrephomene gubernaculifera]
MKQKSIGAFFTGAKPAAKDSAKGTSVKAAEPKVQDKKEPANEQDAHAEQLEDSLKPARKRLRRTVIEDEDDDGEQTAAPAVASSGATGVAQPASAMEDGDEPSKEKKQPATADASPPSASPSAAAPVAAALSPSKAAAATAAKPSTTTAPLASIFQRPAARKAAAAAAAAAAAGSSPARPSGKTQPAAGSASAQAGPSSGKAASKAAATAAPSPRKTTATAAAVAAPPEDGKKETKEDDKDKEEEQKAKPAPASESKKKEKKPKAKSEDEEASGEEDIEDDEEEEDGEDPISDSDEDAGGEVNEILPLGGGDAGDKKKKKDGAKRAAKAASKAAKGEKMEGVGTGALAAASKYAAADIASLITWKPGSPVPYSLLANTFEAIAETTKRLEIVALLVSAFRAILATTPADLLPATYLCVNRVAPAHTGIELGIGEATLIRALCEATGKNEASIKKAYEASGDLGVVAVGARSTQRTMFQPPPLTIASVLKSFRDIAQTAGNRSVDNKRGMIVKMLAAAKGNEAGYIIRSLQAKLRIGLAEQSVLVALAHAVHLHREGVKEREGRLAERLEAAAQVVKQAYSECPSYDVLIPALLEQGTADLLTRCHFMPGVPVKPMLAKATNSVGEVLEKFTDSEFTVEYKYDGERAQVHVVDAGKTVHIFSRNAENNTPKYPDIVARLRGLLKPHVQSIVFDSEAVAYDPDRKKILPFQVLSTRARKDVSVGEIKVQVVLFAFDCLYLNGESLLHRPLTERRQALYGALVEKPGELEFASAKTSRDVEELEGFLNESVEAGTEGLIVKTLADSYEPSKRSSHWLKLKKDYMEGVGDTFDVVPLGAFFGKGKRTGVYGAYLLGVYDPDTETYQTISKLGTGFSEEQLAQLADTMRPHIIPQPRKYYRWSEGLVPDVWFDAAAVWEVKAADLSISPKHQAAMGLVDPSKGISIRFPRLIRVRDDKSPEDATTAAQVADMFRSQAIIKQQQAAKQKEQEAEEE